MEVEMYRLYGHLNVVFGVTRQVLAPIALTGLTEHVRVVVNVGGAIGLSLEAFQL